MGEKPDDFDWLEDAIEEAIPRKALAVRPDSKARLTIEVESEWIVDEVTEARESEAKESEAKEDS